MDNEYHELIDASVRVLLEKESEYAGNYDKIVRQAFNIGDRYTSHVIESMDVLGKNYSRHPKMQLELELPR